jgi:hypothetical protein
MACTLREMGRLADAHERMRALVPRSLEVAPPGTLTVLAEDYAAILAEVGDHRSAVRLLGAADAMRQRLGSPRHTMQAAEIAGPVAKTRDGLPQQTWDRTYEAGRSSTIEAALREVSAVDAP